MSYRAGFSPLRSCRCEWVPTPLRPYAIFSTWNCCSCGKWNPERFQFCLSCDHARDLVEGETDHCLVDLGLARFLYPYDGSRVRSKRSVLPFLWARW